MNRCARLFYWGFHGWNLILEGYDHDKQGSHTGTSKNVDSLYTHPQLGPFLSEDQQMLQAAQNKQREMKKTVHAAHTGPFKTESTSMVLHYEMHSEQQQSISYFMQIYFFCRENSMQNGLHTLWEPHAFALLWLVLHMIFLEVNLFC